MTKIQHFAISHAMWLAILYNSRFVNSIETLKGSSVLKSITVVHGPSVRVTKGLKAILVKDEKDLEVQRQVRRSELNAGSWE